MKPVTFFLYFHKIGTRPPEGIKIILVSSCLSSFMSLIQGHLKALNPLSFSSLLYFSVFHISQAFLYPLNPWQSGTRLDLWATCLPGAIPSGFSLVSACLCWLYDILNAHTNPCCLPPTYCMWTHFLLACYSHSFMRHFWWGTPASCLL